MEIQRGSRGERNWLHLNHLLACSGRSLQRGRTSQTLVVLFRRGRRQIHSRIALVHSTTQVLFPATNGSEHNKIDLELFRNSHRSTTILTTTNVLWSREQRHQSAIEHELVPINHLVRSNDQINIEPLHEGLDGERTILVGDHALAGGVCLNDLTGIRPDQVCHQPALGNRIGAHQTGQLMKRSQRWRQSTMNTARNRPSRERKYKILSPTRAAIGK